MSTYDVTVIGTGPGGYVCAIRAAQLGMKVAVVEKRVRNAVVSHGGTCLNVGCIPSKALLHATQKYADLNGAMQEMGIHAGERKFDLAAMMAFKEKGVKGNVDGIAYLLKKNGIDVYEGTGRIAAPGMVEVSSADGASSSLQARHIVIATGSQPASLPGVEADGERVVTSDGALSLAQVPERMVVIGGGVIGLEMGSVWHRLGAEVTVIETLDQILPGFDLELVKQFQRSLKKQGFTLRLGHKVTGIERSSRHVQVGIEAAARGERDELGADVVLVAIGRTPYTEGLGLEALGVRKDNRGRIEVDAHYQTSIEGVYAIGDVIKGPMLAHKASDEGSALAEGLAGQKPHVNYDLIPGVVYTSPEIAVIGKNEEQLKDEGIAYASGKFPFSANGRARVSHAGEGFVKVLADAASDRVLGVHIIGANASELIGEATVLMEFGGSAEDLARTCHAHPTLSEAIREAALAVDKRAVHF